jgi:hypothetical protein
MRQRKRPAPLPNLSELLARLDAGELATLPATVMAKPLTDSTTIPARGDITITICDRTSVKAVVIEDPQWRVEEIWMLVQQLVKKVAE